MKVFVTPQAEKQFLKLPPILRIKVHKKLSYLEKNPFAGKKLTGELKGKWSLKIWPYRIIYLIDKKKQVWILLILHRQGAYKK